MSYYHTYKKGLYRSRHGVLLGICRGVSDYFNLPVFWIRFALIILFLISGFFPIVLLYVLAGLIMKKEPASSEENRCNDRYSCYADRYNDNSRDFKKRLDRLKNKIREAESNMSYREYQWNRKFNEY